MSRSTSALLALVVLGSKSSGVNGFAPYHAGRTVSPVRDAISIFPKATLSFDVVSSRRTGAIAPDTALSMGPLLDEAASHQLLIVTLEKIIDSAVPSLFVVFVSLFIISAAKSGNRDNDRSSGMRRGGKGGKGMMGMMGMGGGGGGGRGRGSSSFSDFDRPSPVEELYDDVYDDLSGSNAGPNASPLLKLLGGRGGNRDSNGGFSNGRPPSKVNLGIPKKQYMKVTKLNSKFDSYEFSITAATKGKAAAAKVLRAKGFSDAFSRSIGANGNLAALTSSLSRADAAALIRSERALLFEGGELVQEIADLTREITNAAILEEMEHMGVEPGTLDAKLVEKNVTDVIDAEVVAEDKETSAKATDGDAKKVEEDSKKKQPTDIMKAVKELEKLNTELLLLELDFVQSIVEILGPDQADAVRTALVGNVVSGEVGSLLKSLEKRPLASVLSTLVGGDEEHSVVGGNNGKNLFVTNFPGDTSASQLNNLREEVTAILRSSNPGDEALVILESGGGTVTGYGLAAAQLLRIKAAGMKLTVCVEQVAASGGYMMCCVADRIVASPFSVLGSIGVISEVPNAYERLKREGIEFQTITAGKFKRTVTPTKKISKEDIAKSKEDIEAIYSLFKSFVGQNRPQLDIDKVATGETWFGTDALELRLCDEIAAADDVLLEYVDGGYNVFEVEYDPEPESVGGLFAGSGLPGSSVSASTVGGWRGVVRSLTRGIISEVKAELSSATKDETSVQRRYMAKDASDTVNRIRMED